MICCGNIQADVYSCFNLFVISSAHHKQNALSAVHIIVILLSEDVVAFFNCVSDFKVRQSKPTRRAVSMFSGSRKRALARI